jgi:hypothetical protein
MPGLETSRNFTIRFIHKNFIFLLLLCHCILLHVANVSLAYPVRRSQQQFDTYEKDPYWKTSVHLHATKLTDRSHVQRSPTECGASLSVCVCVCVCVFVVECDQVQQ